MAKMTINHRHFSLRTLLSVMTGFSFIGLVVQWFISSGAGDRPLNLSLSVIPWALGSFTGIAIAARRHRSTLFGAMVGGTLGALICPGLIIVFLYLNGMNGVRSLNGLWLQLAFAACGGGLLAAFVGIPREGITIRRNRGNIELLEGRPPKQRYSN